jgi:GNAT superfamily N-acetyltransferase
VKVILRAVAPTDRDWLASVLTGEGVEDFASPDLDAGTLSSSPGFIAHVEGDRLGAISYRISPPSYEILMVYSGRPGLGIGRALVNSVLMEANDAKCDTVTVVARNANGKGVSFFQSIGFKISAVRPTEFHKTTRRIAKGGSVPAADTEKRDEIELSFTLKR